MDIYVPSAVETADANALSVGERDRRYAAVRAELAKTHPHWEIDHLMPGRDSSDPDAFRIATTDLTYMHLRHTAVTRLAEAEVDV